MIFLSFDIEEFDVPCDYGVRYTPEKEGIEVDLFDERLSKSSGNRLTQTPKEFLNFMSENIICNIATIGIGFCCRSANPSSSVAGILL